LTSVTHNFTTINYDVNYNVKGRTMSFWDRDTEDWFRRWFGGRGLPEFGREGGRWFGSDISRQFDEMRREMERIFENIQTRTPKELVREYETPEGGKVREVGPLVYGYSMTIGPDGKPKVREFGNAKSLFGPRGIPGTGTAAIGKPLTAGEIEPLSDMTITDKEVKVVVEMPGVDKKDIKISAYDSSVEVSTADKAQRKYRSVVELPPEADLETVKSTYNNGILEITFKKKGQTKPKGKEIKVE
jgi:HSP20 family protein